MRKETYFRMPRAEALALLAAAPSVHLATTGPDGAPILRTLNAVVHDGWIVFHGAPVGEKTLGLDRPCVVSAEETVASIPSYFTDPERACPATTLYRSVQAHGVLRAIDEPVRKAAALQALMQKLQPDGGHAPITHDAPLYARELASLLVFGVALDSLDGKAKLAQNRKPDERAAMIAALFRRGEPGDLRAIDQILAANPRDGLPAFLRAPGDARVRLCPVADHAEQVAALLAGTYWNDRFSAEEIAAAHRASTAWLVLVDARDRVVASARAISDGHKRAWIYDVIVAQERRGQRLGDAIVRLLLAHPAVRRARFVHLGTRDAEGFYARLGFAPTASLPKRPYPIVEMVRAR